MQRQYKSHGGKGQIFQEYHRRMNFTTPVENVERVEILEKVEKDED